MTRTLVRLITAILMVPLIAAAALPNAAVKALAHPPPVLSAEQERGHAEEITAFRKKLSERVAAKDARGLRLMYAERFTHTDPTGKLAGREARIGSLLSGEPVIETAPVRDLEIRVPGGWTAIATGVSPIKASSDDVTYAVRWTAVYVRGADGGWMLAASHASRVGPWVP